MRTSFDDLKNVFDRDWIRRIWTYQEVMLASNPIIVCGHYHLQWVRLVCSILFLEQFATLTNYDQEFEDILDVWKTLAYSKARFTSESTSWHAGHWKLHQLENYRSFARSIALKHVGIRKRLRDLHNIVSLFCRPLVPVLLHKFPPDLRLPPQALILEEWVDTILSRNATNPKDKSFGLHNILQNLLKYTIPPPDYSISIGQIYKELSVHLIKATGLLHLLLPAALNSFPDQPSWVPDWSKSPPKGWRDSRLYSQSPKDSVCGWSAENSNALTVQARQLGIVCSCYKFRSTEDSYNQSERIIHLGNLEALVGFIGTFNSSRLAYTFLQQALHNTGNFRIPGTYLREFVRFTYKLHGNTLSRIFHGLLDDSNRDKWRILLPRRQIWPLTISAFVLPTWETFDFLHTHIRLCNYLAINKLSLVRVKTGESCYDVGVCTSNAEACDKVIYVSGGCSLFLVRGDASSARLVSPARMLRQRFQAANNTSDTGFWEKVVPAQSSRSSSQAIMDLIPEDYTLY
jgi:hypothetical protein